MSTETLKQMEDRWALLMAATDSRTGERIADRDMKYRRECFALRTRIEDRKIAEATGPKINTDQLAWLDRAQGATKDGKRLAISNDVSGTPYQQNLQKARAAALSGQDISNVIQNTEAAFAKQGITMPESKV